MELKANELRIGNFINDEQTTHIVVGVDNYYVKSYWLKDKEKETLYETPIKLCKPIPLTEEWLLKFKILRDYDGLFILSDNLKLSLGCDNVKIFLNGIYLCETKGFVHVLQNIIFALTNKELEIKM